MLTGTVTGPGCRKSRYSIGLLLELTELTELTNGQRTVSC